MSPLKDWRYEELRERMVAELPPRRRGVEEDPRIAGLRAVLRHGECADSDTWTGDCGVLLDLVEEAEERGRQDRLTPEDEVKRAPRRRRSSRYTYAAWLRSKLELDE